MAHKDEHDGKAEERRRCPERRKERVERGEHSRTGHEGDREQYAADGVPAPSEQRRHRPPEAAVPASEPQKKGVRRKRDKTGERKGKHTAFPEKTDKLRPRQKPRSDGHPDQKKRRAHNAHIFLCIFFPRKIMSILPSF